MTLDEIKKTIEAGDPDGKALEMLDAYITEHPHAEEAYILRGMRYWSMSKRSKAITDYLSAIRLNPDSQAKTLLASANQILDFYNKDLYNP